MMKNKQMSSKNKQFVSGGNNHMFGKSGSVAQQPGVTATSHGKGTKGVKAGGAGRMFGKQTSKAAKPL